MGARKPLAVCRMLESFCQPATMYCDGLGKDHPLTFNPKIHYDVTENLILSS